MIFKILKKDITRKKIITVAVFIFIMLSSMLLASGTNMIIDLTNSLDYLFEKADAPHFVQYHSGEIDEEVIDKWSKDNELVKQYQIDKMINIEGSKIYFGDSEKSQVDTVMEMGFVKQSQSFDFLLNLQNEKIVVKKGEIAVPIFFMEKENLKIGDKVVIKHGNREFIFIISDFIRDAQMNPSIVNSKRFVVNETDYNSLSNGVGEIEYIISFKLNNIDKITEFSNQYSFSDLPKKGPAIQYELLKLLNSVTDGLIAAVIILIALLINMIALLCLRFTIIATIEEDYREIGIMKAIGIRPKDIRTIHIAKYFFIASLASIIGYIISIFFNNIVSNNILLYVGLAPKNIIQRLLPFFMTLLIFVVVIAFCSLVLRKLNKISAIEAIRLGNTGVTYKNTNGLALYKSIGICSNVFIGIRDVFLRFKLYALLFIVFIVCTFIMIVPINFFNTIQSPGFVSYMGMARSDIFIDLRQSSNTVERYNEMIQYIKNDPNVERYSPLITCKYEILNNEGYEEGIAVQTGDFSILSLEYLDGVSPILDNEIALSYLRAKELQKEVGDTVELKINDEFRTMIISGIYQDITNGGRTAKANIAPNHSTALWYNVCLDVDSNISLKIKEYEKIFNDAKITDIKGYFQQTFGNIIDQLWLLLIIAISISILIAILITSLFIKMLITKDSSQIAIMRSIGIGLIDIQKQYMTRSLIILNGGIILGTVISNTFGQSILSIVLSNLGASRIQFIINPIQAYVLCPLLLIVVVTITTFASIRSINKFNISDINVE
ncbi:FtsX-like permease family protein [Clostridium sediminicola]|uniref:ABC transporter permease n=1 Tax=Clostridium sediminicola TaxID=3114879 RepID=UPI0031F21A3E